MKNKITKLDIQTLEPIDILDEEEKAIHNELKKGNFILKNDAATLKAYADIFKKNNRARKALSLRMPKNQRRETLDQSLSQTQRFR